MHFQLLRTRFSIFICYYHIRQVYRYLILVAVVDVVKDENAAIRIVDTCTIYQDQ